MRSFIDASLLIAWLHAACLMLPSPVAHAQSEPGAAATPLAQPLGGGGGSVLEPLPSPDPPRQQRKVYVCRDAGTPVFTDRPCGPSAAIQEIEFTAPGAGSAASLAPQAASASTLPRVLPAAAADAVTPEQARCAALRERLTAIDRQMRSGYSAREAARLWQKWRDTRAQLRARRC